MLLMKCVLCSLLILSASCVLADDSQKPIKICLDSADWRPFIYQESGQVKGMHIETIRSSLNTMNLSYEFIPAPWKRCLKGVEKGRYDAIATASFNQDRAAYLWYPSDASALISTARVGQVQYNIIVHSSSNFQYDNGLTEVPQPVRVPRDYSIGKDLKAMGIEIDDSSLNDLQNLKRLVREKNGAVIALPSLVTWANQHEEFAGKIKLIEKPLKSKSYFLVFSKKGQINADQAQAIWQQIQAARENAQFKEYNSYGQ